MRAFDVRAALNVVQYQGWQISHHVRENRLPPLLSPGRPRGRRRQRPGNRHDDILSKVVLPEPRCPALARKNGISLTTWRTMIVIAIAIAQVLPSRPVATSPEPLLHEPVELLLGNPESAFVLAW